MQLKMVHLAADLNTIWDMENQKEGAVMLMSKFSKFITDIVLPDKVGKERRKKILSEGIIEIWQSEEQDRKSKEAKEIAKETYKKARSSKEED